MALNRTQDFMVDNNTALTTNAKDIKGAINEVNANVNSNTASLAAIATFPQRLTGETDDSPAINRAIANGAIVIMLPTSVQLNSPINATNRADKPLKFIGQGWSEYGGAGTIVHANTGGIAFDTTGSQFVSFEDILIYSDNTMTTPSTIGVLVARSSTNDYAQFHDYKRLFIYLVSQPSANSGQGSIGLLNISGEHFSYDHGYIIADLPMALMATNQYNVSSPFTSFGSIASASLISFKQVGFLAITNSSMVLYDCYNVKFDMCYWARTPINNTIQAIVLNNVCSDITINGQIEQYQRAIQQNGTTTNLYMDIYIDGNATLPLFYLYGAVTLNNPRISIRQNMGTIQQIIDTNNSPIINGGEIIIQAGQGLNKPALKLVGTNIILSGQNANAVVVSSDSTYSINGSKISKISDGSAGYIQYINGHTEQWMNVLYNAGANVDQTFNFPLPFTNSCDNVQVTPIGAAGVTATNNGSTVNGVTLRCSSSPTNIFVRVIGH